MAAGAFDAYENGLLKIAEQSVNFSSDTIKAALLTSGYTPNIVAHDFFDDVSASECADGDYAQITLASKTLGIVSGKLRFDCANLDFGNSVTITAKYLVIYKDTGTPATSPLLFIVDLNTAGGSASSVSSDFDLAIAATGIYEITVNV